MDKELIRQRRPIEGVARVSRRAVSLFLATCLGGAAAGLSLMDKYSTSEARAIPHALSNPRSWGGTI